MSKTNWPTIETQILYKLFKFYFIITSNNLWCQTKRVLNLSFYHVNWLVNVTFVNVLSYCVMIVFRWYTWRRSVTFSHIVCALHVRFDFDYLLLKKKKINLFSFYKSRFLYFTYLKSSEYRRLSSKFQHKTDIWFIDVAFVTRGGLRYIEEISLWIYVRLHFLI